MARPALASGAPLELAVVCDLLAERWFSMDLLADMLLEHASRRDDVRVRRIRPTSLFAYERLDSARGASRLQRWRYWAGIACGRFVEYPLALVPALGRYDAYHVADHSYAHLLFELPRGRSGVYCHDIDAFRPALESDQPASRAQRALARLLVAGLRRASVVFHSTPTVRRDLVEHGLVPAERLVHVPYGVAAEFGLERSAEDAELEGRPPFILHVGSLIPRKNPDFLLRLALDLCERLPELEFFQIGGTWNAAQREALERSSAAGRVHQFSHKGRRELAPYYRAAKAVLLPSHGEGFGLPVIEALACGAPVVASDLPVLREVAGPALVLEPVNDLDRWRAAVLGVLEGRAPSREVRLTATTRYSWEAHARSIVETYQSLVR